MRGAPHSLRRRLLSLVLAAIAAVSLLQATSTYQSALRQADAMFDQHLQDVARSVHGGVPFAPPGLPAGTWDLVVQIWGSDGTQIFASSGPVLPAQALLGFSDISVAGARYRVYTLQGRDRIVQIAQDLDARTGRARLLAMRAVLPVLLLAPLLMLAVWWLIDRSLAPLERMRRQVARRPAEDLSPLPEGGVPQEVLPLVRELNLLFGRVRLAFAAQQQFVADAAHELRSPLTALKLQAQALRRPGNGAPDPAVARLNEGIERAIQTLAQLLVLARQDGAPDAGWQQVDLQEVARAAIGDVLPLAQARRIDLGLATAEPLAVRGQREPLEILLRNLLDNAVKYAPAGGRVDLSLVTGGGAPCLVVEDSGPGIPPAERQRVFDRFYRVAGTEAMGSGLGLAIVQAIAARHGASVQLDASPRLGGLRVQVRFAAPAGDAGAPESA